jgi:hypothetical protein
MGVVETLIHTLDVVRGLHPADPWLPSGALAAPVIARLFPDAPSGDPADVLLYCYGRAWAARFAAPDAMAVGRDGQDLTTPVAIKC